MKIKVKLDKRDVRILRAIVNHNWFEQALRKDPRVQELLAVQTEREAHEELARISYAIWHATNDATIHVLE